MRNWDSIKNGTPSTGVPSKRNWGAIRSGIFSTQNEPTRDWGRIAGQSTGSPELPHDGRNRFTQEEIQQFGKQVDEVPFEQKSKLQQIGEAIGGLFRRGLSKDQQSQIRSGGWETVGKFTKPLDAPMNAYRSMWKEAKSFDTFDPIGNAPRLLDAAKRGFTGETETSIREVLPKAYQDFAEAHPKIGAVTDMAADAALNPSTWMGAGIGGALSKVAEKNASKLLTSGAVKSAEKSASNAGRQVLKTAEEQLQDEITTPNPERSGVIAQELRNQTGKTPGDNPFAQRKFPSTLIDSKNTSPELKKLLKEDDFSYTPISNKESLDVANKRISDNLEAAVDYVKNTPRTSAEKTATAIQLINKFQNEGNPYRAVEIAESISEQLTKAGQMIQAASIYSRLSPEGILLTAQRRINKLNQSRWLKGIGKDYALSPEDAENLKKLAEDMQNLTGDAKIEASQELQAALQALGKSGIDRKIESAQTIGHLLNPRTVIRNTVGNELFYRLERINKYVATPIDWARSAITGSERTVTFRTAGQDGYWEGFLKGVKAGWKGVNPQGLSTQYDLISHAFKGKWNPLTYMEKALGATLKGFDYAAYNRAVNKTLGEMAELRVMNESLKGATKKEMITKYVDDSSKNLLDIADQYGKYVTFQDSNLLSKGLSAVKRGLNLGKEFGAGSIIVKYPRTPGALIMRGMEYSPAGVLKSAYELAKPILKGGNIDTREVTLSLSRAITGSLGFTGLGWFLAENEVITGKTTKDSDVNAMQRDTGGGSYKVNVSAILRWVKSGFDTQTLQTQYNDTLVSYDWMQPIAMSISFGANMNQNYKEGRSLGENAPSVISSSLEGALDTIAQQPVLQGILRVMQGYSLGQNFVNTLQQIPASFVPTLVNQIRQISDNTGRNTYDPNVFYEAMNMVKNKIPGLEKTLPEAYTTLGKEKQISQKPSWFNAFFNPANVTEFKPSPIQEEILRIYDVTGEKLHFPRVVDKSVTYNGQKIELSGKQYSEYQKLLGKKTEELFTQVMDLPKYESTDDGIKVNWLQQVITMANDQAKYELFK